MTFPNEKKTFLSKLDKSKKGVRDEKILPLLQLINRHPDYYTTSSCSGRVYLWKGSGKKNETQWLKMSHELITAEFLEAENEDDNEDGKEDENEDGNKNGLIWLRLEPLILHVACKDLAAANTFLELSRKLYKKSCLLSLQNKLIVEVRGSEFVEMPLYLDGKLLFAGEKGWLAEMINSKLQQMAAGRQQYYQLLQAKL